MKKLQKNAHKKLINMLNWIGIKLRNVLMIHSKANLKRELIIEFYQLMQQNGESMVLLTGQVLSSIQELSEEI
jgi:hypothetical protein